MAYVCELNSNQRVYLESQGEHTIVTLTSSGAGQQQQASNSFQTGSWVSPPEVFVAPQGAAIKIKTARGDRYLQVQGGTVTSGGASSAASSQQMQVHQVEAPSTPPMEPMQPMQPMEPMQPMQPMKPMESMKSDLPPMKPMKPIKMGNMEMSGMNSPMEMRMGNMQMSMGNTRMGRPTEQTRAGQVPSNSSPQPSQSTRRFCSQCGVAVDADDRFCSSCGHRLV
jgi:zinc-ribbon domain